MLVISLCLIWKPFTPSPSPLHPSELLALSPCLSLGLYAVAMSSQETFSINAAAKLTGYSVPTVRKRLPDLAKAGAVQVEGGLWQIPLSALHAVGLMSKVEGETLQPAADVAERADSALQVKLLQVELDGARQVIAVQAEALQRADRALLALEGRQPAKPSSGPLGRFFGQL
jgi:hypothetical protein